MLVLERHAASTTHNRTIAGMLAFLVLADVRVRVTVELAEHALVVTLTSVPDVHRISKTHNVNCKHQNRKLETI